MFAFARRAYSSVCEAVFHRVSREADIDSMLCNMYRGFTKFARVDYVKLKEENRLVNDGVTAKVRI
jgi:hypothetical protein